jgi:hypothetical protein
MTAFISAEVKPKTKAGSTEPALPPHTPQG